MGKGPTVNSTLMIQGTLVMIWKWIVIITRARTMVAAAQGLLGRGPSVILGLQVCRCDGLFGIVAIKGC